MKTVREVCELVGITRKTLRGYDEIGLLSPTVKLEEGNKSWLYDDEAILKLMGIQAFVEVGYGRKEIMELQNAPAVTLESAIDDALVSLEERMRRIEGMIRYFKSMKVMVQSQAAGPGVSAREVLEQFHEDWNFSQLLHSAVEGMSSDATWDESEAEVYVSVFSALSELSRLKDEAPDSIAVQDCTAKVCDQMKRFLCKEDPDCSDFSAAESAAGGIAFVRALQSEAKTLARYLPKTILDAAESMEESLRIYCRSQCETTQDFEDLMADF